MSLRKLVLGTQKAITIDDFNFRELAGAPEIGPATRGGAAVLSLAGEFQTRLVRLGLLDPQFSGSLTTPFGPSETVSGAIDGETRNALLEFCKISNIPYDDQSLTGTQLEAMDNAAPDKFLPIQFETKAGDDPSTRFAKRVLRYMRDKGYWIARSPNMYNIVYVEGVNEVGKPNDDAHDRWNDRRLVIQIQAGGKPVLVVNDEATTEPGRFYTQNPVVAQGAARIAFGQYKAWVVGLHGGKQPALRQAGTIRVHRDLNKDAKRSASDPMDVGDLFFINQHTTSETLTPELVGKFSAGCLVGRRYRSHMTFLATVKKDVRYQRNNAYMFVTAIIPGDDLAAKQPL